jgi:alkylation response protein AidB-like acyl-CoA dehydrogenase
MDVEFDENERAIAELAQKIFTERADADRVRAVEQQGGFDGDLWRTLAEAGLLAVAAPEQHGGAGLGMVAMVALLEQQGRRVAPVPLWPVLVGAVQPIAAFGTDAQQARWLPGLLAGSTIVTAALPDHAAAVGAEPYGDGWRLTGAVPAVPAGPEAAAFVVAATTSDGVELAFLVPAERAGLAVVPVRATDQLSAAAVQFDGVAVGAPDVLAGEQVGRWIRRRARVALAALAIGVCSEAVAMTAAYTSQRVQFGRPLSTNQGVALRAADAYIDTQNIRLTTYRAASLLDEGREEAGGRAALVAKWWAARGGLRVVHATQHLHGGMGADVDYPIHRYFLWGRQLAFTLGTAAAVEAELGDALAAVDSIG